MTPQPKSAAELYVLSIFYYFAAKLLIKYIPHVPAFEVVFFRALISLIMCIYVIRTSKITFKGTNKLDLLMRGIFGSMGVLAFFYSLQHLPLATATALINLSPIFTILLATVLLKEKTKTQDWVLFSMAFMGVLLLKGFDSKIPTKDFLIGMSAPILASIAYIFIRRLKDKEDPNVVVFSLSFVAIPVFIIPTITQWVTPTPLEWVMILAIGILIQVAQVNLTRALQMAKTTSSLVHYTYLDVVISAIAGYFIFHEEATKMTLVGIGIIISSVYLIRQSHKKIAV
jgi:drug/metabolite transporter (DMT)-like permease